jgi:hypothetical protein
MSVGKVFFAWVAASEVFDAAVHAREDEAVFSLRIRETEGEFATATVEVRNPRRGLLSPARKQRVYISAEIEGIVELLFAGRVVGMPVSLGDETMELEFLGRPDDHAEVLQAFLPTLRAGPHYHPALVPEESRDDPSVLLEGLPALLHWHRATGALSLSRIDWTGSIDEFVSDALEDSLSVTFDAAPVNAVKVQLELSWTQTCPVFAKPFVADPGYGASGAIAAAFDGRPVTLTGEDLVNRWPAPGSTLDGGWTVLGAYLRAEPAGSYTRAIPVGVAPPPESWLVAQETLFGSRPQTYPVDFIRSECDGNLVLSGVYEQPRREVIEFTVSADLQPVIEFPAPELLSLSVLGEDVAPVEPFQLSVSYRATDEASGFVGRVQSHTMRRGDLRRPALAAQSALSGPLLAAAVARAEARLRRAARCVTVGFETDFARGARLSTASSVGLYDERLPGSVAAGKVTALELVVTGEGQCYASVELGCSVGRAASLSTPTVVAGEYDAPFEPTVVTLCRSGLVDDGTRAVASVTIRNPISEQEQALADVDVATDYSAFKALGYKWAALDAEAAVALLELRLSELPTEVDAQLVSLEALDETVTAVPAAVSGFLGILRGVDLEFDGGDGQ